MRSSALAAARRRTSPHVAARRRTSPHVATRRHTSPHVATWPCTRMCITRTVSSVSRSLAAIDGSIIFNGSCCTREFYADAARCALGAIWRGQHRMTKAAHAHPPGTKAAIEGIELNSIAFLHARTAACHAPSVDSSEP